LGIKGERVRKDIAMLAFEPLNMNLTVISRKTYLVMLHIAQTTTKSQEGGYTAPLASIVRGSGTSVKLGKVVVNYLNHMTSTNVIFRPVSESEQHSLLADDERAPAADTDESEARIFPLLSEARITRKGGDIWVTWFYPPTIEEQIIDPTRWAVIELDVIAMLSTYTAVALYEIVARYRDAPGHLTPKRKAEFWVPILRGNSNSKDREWRKFKAEFVLPAIDQINAVSDLNIEVVEHKYGGRRVEDVQFKVVKKPRLAPSARWPVDVSVVTEAMSLGFSQGQAETLLDEFGDERMKRALAQFERRKSNTTLDPIGKPLAYLRGVLANLEKVDEQQLAGESSPATATAPPPGIGRPDAEPGASREELTTAFEQRRLDRVAAQFTQLTELEQADWMDRYGATLETVPALAPMLRRIREREWRSPRVYAALMKFYAQQALDLNWENPTADDLAALSAEMGR
jgi:hypothetical protein